MVKAEIYRKTNRVRKEYEWGETPLIVDTGITRGTVGLKSST